MSPFFDSVGNDLSSMTGSDPANNTVDYIHDQIYPESILNPCASDAANKQANQQIRQSNQCSYGALKSPLGPEYGTSFQWSRAVQDWAQFFKGSGPGNEFTQRNISDKPVMGKGPQGVNPEEFYEKFYTRMRHFSQAEALASKGADQVRTR
jgi:hypothetical protein